VDWARCFVFWGDERATGPDSPDSNFRMANETLLSHVPLPQENIYRIRGEEPPEQAAAEYEQQLRAFAGGDALHFDLVLLGLGTNGHTASLFPQSLALEERERWCVSVWVPELNANRITLTAPLLNDGLQVVFLVAGADKAHVAAEVLRGPYEPDRLPAQLIRPSSGTLLWLLDDAAAADLKTGQP
jgi:6-phosphogluconolactonase